MARHVERPFTHVPEDRPRLNEAEKEGGYGLRIGVGPYLPVGLSLSDNRGHLVQVLPNAGEHPRPAIGPSEVHVLREDDAREGAVVPDEGDVPPQEPPETLERVGCFGPDGAHVVLQAVADVPEDGLDHLVLAREVPVQRGGNEADAPREAADAQSAQAMRSDEVQRRLDDLLAADEGVELSSCH